jgi:hypothetical protein
LTFEVNAIGTAKTLVLLQSQDFFLLPPSAFQSYGVTYTTNSSSRSKLKRLSLTTSS